MNQGEKSTRSSGPAEDLPARIGDYRILCKLGEGGMGVVYEAEQQHPKRVVALKVILGGRYVDETHVKMFQREAQTLARLRHPGIAGIYESGRTEDGHHYFAMELVRGETLTNFLKWRSDRAGLSAEELKLRLGMFRRICEAVSYAHQRGVIHRDLKPSNILVPRAATSGSGSDSASVLEIKVLDFGLARMTDTDVAVSTYVTDAGKVMGTLPYMSPEQVRGNPDEIDIRTDVYSLGVILYQMLTGRLPYQVQGLGILEAGKVIHEATPEPLTRTWSGHHKPDRDIETIVHKALEKDPAQRYQSVSAMAGDVERYLSGQPILARPPSMLYQLRKMVARHKAAFVSAAAFVALLAASSIALGVLATRLADERDRANREADTAHEVSEFLVSLFEVSDPERAQGDTIAARTILDRGADRIDRELRGRPLMQADLMETMGRVYKNLGAFDRAEVLLEDAHEIREDSLGTADAVTARGLTRLAELYRIQGRLDEALETAERALEVQAETLGPDHVDTALSRYVVGSIRVIQGELEDGRRMLERAMHVFERELGPEHRYVSWCLNDMGYGLATRGKLEQALPLFERALEIKEKSLGPEHPDVAMGLNNVGYSLGVLGQYDRAQTILERAVRIDEKVVGPDNPIVAIHLHSLADVLRLKGEEQAALEILERVLRIQQTGLDSDSLNTADTHHTLAETLTALRRYPEAEQHFKRALAAREAALGLDHQQVADTLDGYAELLRRTGRDGQAESLESRARLIRAASE